MDPKEDCLIMREIYLDYNATTPTDPRVIEAVQRASAEYSSNPSSSTYESAFATLDAIEESRTHVANLLDVLPSEIFFMSGATEANNWIAASAAWSKAPRRQVVTTAIEHDSVLASLRLWEKRGRIELTVCPVESDGLLSVDRMLDSVRPHTVLVNVQAANNEVHTLQPLSQIGEALRNHPALFYADAAQILGKQPFCPRDLGVDIIGFSSHKLYGPKGVGGVWIDSKKPLASLQPLLVGGGQERGLRSGTYNTPAIVGFGEAARLCQIELALNIEPPRSIELRNRLLDVLLRTHPGAKLNGSPRRRLPGGLNVQLPDLDLAVLARGPKRLACSQSSACSSRASEPSHVLTALGLTPEEARNSLRLAVGRFTTEEDVDAALEILAAAKKGRTVCGVLCRAPDDQRSGGRRHGSGVAHAARSSCPGPKEECPSCLC